MKKTFFSLLLSLGLATALVAQDRLSNQVSVVATSGSITANGQSVTLVMVNGYGTVGVQITGTWTGTIQFQTSIDCSTYQTINAFPTNSTTAATSTTGNGVWTATSASLRCFRMTSTAWSSGTAVISLRTGFSGGGGGGGGAGGGAGTEYTEADVDASITGRAILWEDAADTLRAVSAAKPLPVNIISGAGSGGTAAADDSAFTLATTNVTVAGCIEATDSLDAGDLGGIKCGADRELDIDVVSMPADATELPAAAALGDNAANPTIPSVGAFMLCYDDVGVNWDRCRFPVDAIEDAAETAGGTGPMVLGVRRDVAASSAGTTGDNATFNTDALGLMWSRQLDPCSGVAKTFFVVDISTATTVEIANQVASQFFYICSINLVASAAQTVVIGEDDTDGCGSITAGLNGGVTAAEGWSFAANGGIALGDGNSTVMKTSTANRFFCILTGQAAQVSGTIAYVSAP